MNKKIWLLSIFLLALSGCTHEKIESASKEDLLFNNASKLGEPRTKLIIAIKDYKIFPISLYMEKSITSNKKYQYETVYFKHDIPIDSPGFNYLPLESHEVELNEYLKANEEFMLSVGAFTYSCGRRSKSCEIFYIKYVPKADAVYVTSLQELPRARCGLSFNELDRDRDNYISIST